MTVISVFSYGHLRDFFQIGFSLSYTFFNRNLWFPCDNFIVGVQRYTFSTSDMYYDTSLVREIAYGLVALVKKMSVLINFLLQNTNLVSVLSKICPNFAGHVWHISRTHQLFLEDHACRHGRWHGFYLYEIAYVLAEIINIW